MKTRYVYIKTPVVQILILICLLLLIFFRQGAGVLSIQKVLSSGELKMISSSDMFRYDYAFPKENNFLNTNIFSQEASVRKLRISNVSYSIVKQIENFKTFINQAILFCKKYITLVNYWFQDVVLFSIELKNSFLKRLAVYLGEQEKNLVFGMLFGDISQMEDNLKNTLKFSGMLHVVSASGFNISLLVTFFAYIFEKHLSRILWSIFILVIILLYICLADFSPSIIRAATMFIFGLFARLLRRQRSVLAAFFWSVLFLVIISPNFMTSLSFQLSVLATLGIILLVPWLTKSKQNLVSTAYLGGSLIGKNDSNSSSILVKIKSSFIDGFITTFSASLFVSPLLISVFGELSLIGFIANPALLWLTPIITILGLIFFFVFLLFSLLSIPGDLIYQVFSIIIFLPIKLFIKGVEFFNEFGWGVVRFK
jgi:ComEC/Rec2-related protein